jgi:hypothetical protein
VPVDQLKALRPNHAGKVDHFPGGFFRQEYRRKRNLGR